MDAGTPIAAVRAGTGSQDWTSVRTGTWLMWLGVAVVAVGAVLRWAPWLLSWFGNLPGDIRHEGERSSFYFPITSMIVVSVVISIILNLILRRGGS